MAEAKVRVAEGSVCAKERPTTVEEVSACEDAALQPDASVVCDTTGAGRQGYRGGNVAQCIHRQQGHLNGKCQPYRRSSEKKSK